MKVLNHLLMLIISAVVFLSLVGISVKQVGEVNHYSFFIKTEPSIQVFYQNQS